MEEEKHSTVGRTSETEIKRGVNREYSPVNPGKTVRYRQCYRKKWESMPDFKGWLRSVPHQPTRAYCAYCDKSLHAHRLSLLKHTCTLKHTKAAQAVFTLEQMAARAAGGDLRNFPVAKLNPAMKREKESDEESDSREESEENFSTKRENMDTPPSAPGALTTAVERPPLSTHVLDTSKGVPIAGLQVSLYRLIGGRWTLIHEGLTLPNGRYSNFIDRADFVPGRYKLHFDVDRYFELRRMDSLYPFIEIAFDVKSPTDHYHIPLLLSPFGFSTYRGN